MIEACWHAGLSIGIHLDTSNSNPSVPCEAGTCISSEEKASSEPTEKQLSTSITEHCNMGGSFHQCGMSEALLESKKTTKSLRLDRLSSCKTGLDGLLLSQKKQSLSLGQASRLCL